MSGKIGARWERKLVNILTDVDFATLRVPASGSSTERELPDVHVGRDGRSIAFEAKYRGTDQDRIYVKEEKVEGLVWFANQFGSEPRIAARFGGDTTWYVIDPDEANRTPSGNISIHRRDTDDWPTLDEYVED